MGIIEQLEIQKGNLEESVEKLHEARTTKQFDELPTYEKVSLEQNLVNAQNMLAHLRITMASLKRGFVEGEE